ncbi:MAG: hypothetical protein M3376_07985 [Actinomycetota bacterium]|nr:hypothetical protein [Actinomycetota bacterium]
MTIDQVWRRRSDSQVMRVRQVHRADRLVELVDETGARVSVPFTDLRRGWECLA